MSLIDTIFFDLDDTLVAFDAVTEKSWIQVCRDFIMHNDSCSLEKLYGTIRKHSSMYWSDEDRHRKGRLDIESARREVVISAFRELSLPEDKAVRLADKYSKVRIDNMYLFPDAHETLSYLRAEYYKLALITNGDSHTQRSKIERFKLESYFDCIAVEGELGYGKPDERVFNYALKKINSKPGSTIMIGDNLKWDVAGTQKIGIKAIWYDWKNAGLNESLQIRPDFIITSLRQAIEIIRNHS